jgi:hypothetical protein
MLGTLIKWFFLLLGFVFFCLILAGVYLYVADPYEVRPLIDALVRDAPTESEVSSDVSTDDSHPLLTPAQQQALETVGINTAALPSEITPEMEECFEEKLGAERTGQIASGDTPTAAEIFKARSCIE